MNFYLEIRIGKILLSMKNATQHLLVQKIKQPLSFSSNDKK
jgi:hypothetical protein